LERVGRSKGPCSGRDDLGVRIHEVNTPRPPSIRPRKASA
jgi:hypothetical protein